MKKNDLTAEENERRRLQEYIFGLEEVQDRAALLSEEYERLQHTTELLVAVLGSTSAGILLVRDPKFQWLNQGFADIIGWDLDELTGADATSIFPDEGDFSKLKQSVTEKLESEGVARLEFELTHKDGHKIPCLIVGRQIRGPDRSRGFVFSVTDLTEQKAAERKFREGDRLRAVGELAAGVAHNFNNLLQIAMGACQMAWIRLDSSPDKPKIAKYLDHIMTSCRYGAETLKRLQAFCRTEPDISRRNSRAMDITATVRLAIDMSLPWRKAESEGNGAISLNASLTDFAFIIGMENEIMEVALNLIKNAVEAMPDGGRLDIRTYIEDGSVYFQVRDTGMGIKPENLDRIFQPFWTTKSSLGTGMGLSTCYGIVRRHSGDISVESRENEGTVMTVRFPFIGAIAPESVVERRELKHLGLNVLLIDDMGAVLDTLEAGLVEYSGRIYRAESGEEGIAIYEGNDVDVVVCDLGMYGVNGFDVAGSIKAIAREKGKLAPIFLMLTGWGSQIHSVMEGPASGVDKILAKPISLYDLHDEISRMARARGLIPG